MKQLNRIETIIYAAGGLMMALGTGLYAFFIKQDIACIVMLVGAIGFATMQMELQLSAGCQYVVEEDDMVDELHFYDSCSSSVRDNKTEEISK